MQRRDLICCLVFVLLFGNSRQSTQATDVSAKFFRGVNLNGPAIVIDNRQWEGKDAPNYTCNGKAFENQSVTLKPQTDRQRAQMIRSSRWSGNIDVELTSIPAGTYQVLLYVWEDNDPETYDIFLNDRSVLERFNSGSAGAWKRLGPWKIDVRKGTIKLSARGGAANLSGIEVWSGEGTIPQSESAQFAGTPTDEQLAFFEKRIRPLLVERCYECHSASSKEIGGSLLLDSRPGIVKGGDNGPPIVPGDSEASLLTTAVSYTNADLKMPPNKKLSDAEIADLATWITMRAPDPRTTSTIIPRKTMDVTEARTRWPFAPVVDPPVPAVRNAKWPRNDVDRFIRAAQEAKGLSPVDDADRRVLIHRATFDLIGLPPTPAEVTAFVNDAADTPTAFAKVVDRLLESPHYGERWGRHWLDVVRYADTAGDNSDYPIPQMIKYRDWVIEALNRDLPYDQFIRDQLAGDLLDDSGASPSLDDRNQHVIATGYIALARRFGSRVDDYPQHLTIEDTIDNLGRAFLGLSLSCARCHDHKFDPISTDDYYAVYGIFQSTRYPWPGIELEKKQRDLVPLAPGDVVEAATRERKVKLAEFDAQLKRLDEEKKSANDDQKKEIDKRIGSTKKQRDDLNNSPLPFDTAYAVAEGKKLENARIQIKGNPDKTGDEVPRRFLSVLGGQTLPPDEQSSGRRQLADWIASSDNPLTARVMVNRIWLNHFGQGLVPTPNDFGKQGRPPTHPELLDWLSRRFVESGWSMKAMHRLLMNSRTYQLASAELGARSAEQEQEAGHTGPYPQPRAN
ncbi:MAG: PSD1 and planctomycete cytochrome C domain-containing protein [Planctomycetota bacterium]